METKPVIGQTSMDYDVLSKMGLTFQRLHCHHNPKIKALRLKC